MSTFNRRQRILDLLEHKPGITVSQLAGQLGVPESTVRSDLRALSEGRRLAPDMRADDTTGALDIPPSYRAPVRANPPAEQWMARWAADLVQDGEAIALDASEAVYAMVGFLSDRRHLTVLTSSPEVARLLKQEPSNTVILLGDYRPGPGGSLAQDRPCEVAVKTAFVSGTGFTLETGLGEHDAQAAQAKRQLVTCAREVVALIEAARLGVAEPVSFASPAEISRIFTDRGLDPAWTARLRQAGLALTICDDLSALVTGQAPAGATAGRYRIGVATLGDNVPFAIEVRQGLERAAARAGNIDLVLADNRLSASVALHVAERLIAANVDLAIEFQIDQIANDIIMSGFRDANIPVIAVDIPMHGAVFFGVDNYRAGQMAGTALGEWVQRHWGGQLDTVVLMEEPRAGLVPAARLRGQLEGLQSVVGRLPPPKVIHVDCSNLYDVAQVRIAHLLPELSGSRLAFLSINDDVALGALAAIRAAGREEQVVVVGQGATRRGRREIRRPGTRLIGTTAFRAEDYGPHLLALADRILRHEPVPPAVYMEHVFITPDNIDQYYPGD